MREVEEISCDCPDYYNTYGVCKHSLATVLEFNENGFQDIINPNKRNCSNHLSLCRYHKQQLTAIQYRAD